MVKARFSDRPQVNVLCEDFFKHQGKYDLIIEQTFFCAIPPNRRREYAEKTASVLNQNGRIVGVLFDRTFETHGPPFGGCQDEYKQIFEPNFTIKTMEECYNSVLPRANTEIFINLVRE
ncbi:hypothetical protein ACVWYG_002700 [Pedobacter sp. UYEF25]